MMNDNIDAIIKPRRFPLAKIFLTFISLAIALFYWLSALGWFVATYIGARSQVLGDEATKFYQSLNVADHVIRSSQVILIVAASGLLLFFRIIAMKLILISILISFISTALISKWGISFLGGLEGLLLLTIVFVYTYLIYRRGFLH